MKKYTLTAILSLTFIYITAAQEIKLGVKAGLNFATLHTENNDETEDYSNRTGLMLGIMAEMPLSERFAFQPELLFSAQGAKSEITIEEFKYEGTQKLNYLNIPLMVKYFVADGFHIQAGPQVGFLLLAQNEYEDNFLGVDYSEKGEDISEYMNTVAIGLNFGLGYQLENGFYIDARYNLGLTNVRNDKENLLDIKQYNRVFQFSIGYFLN